MSQSYSEKTEKVFKNDANSDEEEEGDDAPEFVTVCGLNHV